MRERVGSRFFVFTECFSAVAPRAARHIMCIGDANEKIFRSMNLVLSACAALKLQGIISRPMIRGGNAKCGCCTELVIYKGTFDEAVRVLDAYAFKYEVSEWIDIP